MGYGIGTRGGDQKTIGGPGGYSWSANTKGTLLGGALTFGKYTRENTLWYGGFAFDKVTTETTVTQDPNVSAGDPGGRYAVDWVANNWAAGGGVQLKAGNRFLMDFGIYYYNTRLSGADGSNSGVSGRMGGQWLFN